jgi:hypothetical protein
MKYLNFKSTLVISLIISSLTTIFSQNKGAINCDTLFLKNGKTQLVNIDKMEKKFIAFYDCENKDALLAYIPKSEVIAIKRTNNLVDNQLGRNYEIVKKPQKLYVEGTLDLRSYLSLGATLSAGYQVNKWVGFGLTAQKDYVFLQIQAMTISSRLLDYRLDFDANKLYFHYGYVSNLQRGPGENCETFELNKSKLRSVYGLTFKHYTQRFVVLGIGVFYSQMTSTETCRNNVSQILKTYENDRNLFAVKLSAGIYGPSRYRKVAIRN